MQHVSGEKEEEGEEEEGEGWEEEGDEVEDVEESDNLMLNAKVPVI